MNHRLLPRYRHDFDQAERGLAQNLISTGRRAPAAPMEAKAGRSEFDPQRLRGIPAIGRNVSGRIQGTDPFFETQRRLDGVTA